MKIFVFSVLFCILAQALSAQWHLTDAEQRELAARPKPDPALVAEGHAMQISVNRASGLAYRTLVIQGMLAEANWAARTFNLPTKRPIQVEDVIESHVDSPWWSVVQGADGWPDTIFGTNIVNPGIPREEKLRFLKIGVSGTITTPDYFFSIIRGRLVDVMRLTKGQPQVEYNAHDLDKLVGKPSLINQAQAYQLATQWLAAMDVDVAALERQFPHQVNQLRYLPRGTTNAVVLPLYFVGFGTNDVRHWGNMPASTYPPVEVEILGTRRELQELIIGRNAVSSYLPYAHRPLLLITNLLDLIRTPNPPMKQLKKSSPSVQTNSVLP